MPEMMTETSAPAHRNSVALHALFARRATDHGDLPRQRRVTDRKPVAEPVDWRRQIGQTIERALEIAHLSKQEVSYRMGYADQSALSRWIAGTERPLFDKLFALEPFYQAWAIAICEQNPHVEVRVVMTVNWRV